MEDENESDSMSFEQFCVSYKEVLAANGVSPHLFKSLHRKLEKEVIYLNSYVLLYIIDNLTAFQFFLMYLF